MNNYSYLYYLLFSVFFGTNMSSNLIKLSIDEFLTQWAFHRVQEHPNRSSDEGDMTFRSWRSCVVRGDNQAGRAGLGWANSGPGQNRAIPKFARFFWAKILTAHPALKTGSVWPNSLFKAKKNSGRQDRAGSYWAGPYWAGPNLTRFFSGK